MRALAVVMVLAVGGAARADTTPEAPLASLVAGVASALVPLAVGGGIAASASVDDQPTRRAGMHVIAAGFAIAPFVSHFVAREWKRGLVFGALPLACSVAAITIMELEPGTIDLGTPASRISYGALLAASILFSTAGLVDSFMLGVRGRPLAPAPRAIAIAPLITTSGGGLALGGRF